MKHCICFFVALCLVWGCVPQTSSSCDSIDCNIIEGVNYKFVYTSDRKASIRIVSSLYTYRQSMWLKYGDTVSLTDTYSGNLSPLYHLHLMNNQDTVFLKWNDQRCDTLTNFNAINTLAGQKDIRNFYSYQLIDSSTVKKTTTYRYLFNLNWDAFWTMPLCGS